MTKFAIISTQRSGSTMLFSMLNSHPDVFCSGEIFYPRSGSECAFQRYVASSKRNRLMHHFARAALVSEFLDEYYQREGFDAVGFKFMYSQARLLPRLYPSVVDYFRQHNVSIIHNVRENYLRVLISRVAAKSTGIYRSQSQTAHRSQKVSLPGKSLVNQLARLRDETQRWESSVASLPYIRVCYEALLAQPQAEQGRLLQFLGVSAMPELKSEFVRLAPDNLEELVENYDQVAGQLLGTEFEYCLTG